ncbi:hypothetical protein E5288_WYG016881 [Bos mutus]|uniref:Uncharacterized protein n=1 Tax=Bos mutus TaxID=72004 RepID=A0A6B0RV94_9CETA|nr:hypothetical protein [Bos mutus]
MRADTKEQREDGETGGAEGEVRDPGGHPRHAGKDGKAQRKTAVIRNDSPKVTVSWELGMGSCTTALPPAADPLAQTEGRVRGEQLSDFFLAVLLSFGPKSYQPPCFPWPQDTPFDPRSHSFMPTFSLTPQNPGTRWAQ